MTTPAPLSLIKLTVSNFLQVEALTVEANGKHVKITGRNSSGKSSSVMALFSALKGFSRKAIPDPIHHGAKRANVTLDLGQYIVELIITPKGHTLDVTAADGSVIERPHELFAGLLGEYSLDPVAFLNQRPKDQVDDVLAICGVACPVQQVKDILGADAPLPLPKESADSYLMRLSADDTGIVYLNRRAQGRVVESKAKAFDEAEAKVVNVGGRLTDADKGQSGTELQEQIMALNAKGVEFQALIQSHADAKRKHADAKRKLEEKEDALVAAQEQVSLLEQQLKEAIEVRDQANGMIDNAIENEQAAAKKIVAAGDALIAFDDPAPRLTIVRERFANVEKHNAGLNQRKNLSAFADQMKSEHEKAVADHEAIGEQLAALRDLRLHLLDGVDLGVPNLTIVDGELNLNGVTFQQASQAQRVAVSCAIAMRQKPALKLLRIDQGEQLDDETYMQVLKLADANSFQVICTAVSNESALRVRIVDAEGGEA